MKGETQELLELEALGTKEFISVLYERYGKKLYGYAIYKWKVDKDDAWELVYRTLYKVLDSYKKYTFENEAKFASFVFKLFINSLRNLYRDNKNKFDLIPIDGEQLQNHPEAQVTERSEHPTMKVLNEELDNMEDWQRMLLLLRSDGMSYAEIARFVDKPENQLKVYYQRLKDQLSKRIHERIG